MTTKDRNITKEELTEKIGSENLALVLNNVYCAECGNTTMVEYEDNITIERSGDKVARLLETGEAKF